MANAILAADRRGVVAGYALLGACWLIFRAKGGTQKQAFRLARVAGIATALAVIAVSAATPFLEGRYYERWLTFPSILFSGSVLVLVGALSIGFWWALLNKRSCCRSC